jgi:hypothetical protein
MRYYFFIILCFLFACSENTGKNDAKCKFEKTVSLNSVAHVINGKIFVDSGLGYFYIIKDKKGLGTNLIKESVEKNRLHNSIGIKILMHVDGKSYLCSDTNGVYHSLIPKTLTYTKTDLGPIFK